MVACLVQVEERRKALPPHLQLLVSNLAVLMQGMAESLAASISHQDQKDRITRRAHGGRYTGWA